MSPFPENAAKNDKALFGPRLHADGTTFRLWAPAARQVELVLDKPHPMRRAAEGWYVLDTPDVGAGTRYKFRIDGELDAGNGAIDVLPEMHATGGLVAIEHRWINLARQRGA